MDNNEKKITPVVSSGSIKLKRKPFHQKLKETFISPDFAMATDGVKKTIVFGIQKTILDGIYNTVSALFFGQGYSANSPISRQINPSWWSNWNTGIGAPQNINYSGMIKNQMQQTQDSIQIPYRGGIKWNEMIIRPNPANNESMKDAESNADMILLSMNDILERFGHCTINDLNELVEQPMQAPLGNYGWTNLSSATKVFYPGIGYWLKLPEPTLLK